jgi:hypothetical protein
VEAPSRAVTSVDGRQRAQWTQLNSASHFQSFPNAPIALRDAHSMLEHQVGVTWPAFICQAFRSTSTCSARVRQALARNTPCYKLNVCPQSSQCGWASAWPSPQILNGLPDSFAIAPQDAVIHSAHGLRSLQASLWPLTHYAL